MKGIGLENSTSQVPLEYLKLTGMLKVKQDDKASIILSRALFLFELSYFIVDCQNLSFLFAKWTCSLYKMFKR